MTHADIVQRAWAEYRVAEGPLVYTAPMTRGWVLSARAGVPYVIRIASRTAIPVVCTDGAPMVRREWSWVLRRWVEAQPTEIRSSGGYRAALSAIQIWSAYDAQDAGETQIN